jgi:uncharacterized protein
VRVTLPDGSVVTNEQRDLAQILSRALGREVMLAHADGDEGSPARAEEYWPDMEGLEHRDIRDGVGAAREDVLRPGRGAPPDHGDARSPARAISHGRFEVRRFRPNIVVSTGPAKHGFVENEWIGRTVAIGDEVRLRISEPCPRCVMTTLPQGDLPRDPGVLRTAAQHNQANVGVYADVLAGGVIRRGDRVALL